MIFGEFSINEYGNDADSFDYHFKHKHRDGHKQTTTGRKGRRKLRRTGNTGAPMGGSNSGLNASNADASQNDGGSGDTATSQNDTPNSSTLTASGNEDSSNTANSSPAADTGTNPAGNSEAESSYDEPEKKEPGYTSKEKGLGAGIGWACLGLTVLIIGVVIARTVKGPPEVSKHIHHHHTS